MSFNVTNVKALYFEIRKMSRESLQQEKMCMMGSSQPQIAIKDVTLAKYRGLEHYFTETTIINQSR